MIVSIISICFSTLALVLSAIAIFLYYFLYKKQNQKDELSLYVYVKLGIHHLKNDFGEKDKFLLFKAENLLVEAGDILLVPLPDKNNLEIATAMTILYSNETQLKQKDIKSIVHNISKGAGENVKFGDSNLELIGFKEKKLSIFKFKDTKENIELYIDMKDLFPDVSISAFPYTITKKNSIVVNASGKDMFNEILTIDFVVSYYDYLDTIIIWGDVVNPLRKIRAEFDRFSHDINKRDKIKKNLKVVK